MEVMPEACRGKFRFCAGDIFGRRAFSLFLFPMLGCQGCMAKDLLLGRCLVKGMSKSLREKIQVLRWGTSSAGGPSHCFYSLCRCVSRSLREKNSGFALGDVFGRKAMPECQGCLAKDLLLEGCLVKVTSRNL